VKSRLPLENAGSIYLAKSGKGLIIRVQNKKVNQFPIYLTASKKAVKELLEGKRPEVDISLIVEEY